MCKLFKDNLQNTQYYFMGLFMPSSQVTTI